MARLLDGSGDIRIPRAERVLLLRDGTGLQRLETIQRLERRVAP